MAAKPGQITVRWRTPSTADAQAASRAAIEAAAIEAVGIITRRTARGVSATGAAFVEYTPRYAAQRAASGRKAKPPDLTLTGTMLRALRVLRVVSPKRAIIGWEGQHVTRDPLQTTKSASASAQLRAVAYSVLVPALNLRRRFFAIESTQDRQRVRDAYTERLARGLASATRGP